MAMLVTRTPDRWRKSCEAAKDEKRGWVQAAEVIRIETRSDVPSKWLIEPTSASAHRNA